MRRTLDFLLTVVLLAMIFFFSRRRRHTISLRDWSSDVCSSGLAGIGHIDTAHLYAGGDSETTIGAALTPMPESLVVATKGGYYPGEGRPDVLRAQIDESLRRLRTDAIGLYYLHRVDPDTPLEDSVGAIKEARDAGKVRHVGMSAVDVDQIERARRVVPIAAVQNHYNLSERRYENVVDHCAHEGIVFVPY